MKTKEYEVNEVYGDFITGTVSGYRYYILYGGRGSGKSEATAIRLVRQCLEQEYFKCILAREYFTNVKDSNFAKIVKVIEDMGVEDLFHITRSPLEIKCKHNGNIFLARGLDSPDKLKSTENPTSLWLEEADSTTESEFRSLDFTLRTDKDVPIEIYMTFNPFDEHHWIIKRFFPLKQEFEKEDGKFTHVQSTKDNCWIMHSTYMHNVFCDSSFLDAMATYKRDDYDNYKVDGLGLFGEGRQGLIYKNWKAVDEMPQGGDKIIAIDYGNVNPSAVIEIVYKDGEVFLNELFYKTGYTQRQLAEACMELFSMDLSVYYDSAEPSLGDELEALGFNCYPAAKGAGSVNQGINFVKSFEPFYVTKHSDNLIKELRRYSWKEDRHGNIKETQPEKLYDHACDAFRYGVYTHGKENWINAQEPELLNVASKKTPTFKFRSNSRLGNVRPTDSL